MRIVFRTGLALVVLGAIFGANTTEAVAESRPLATVTGQVRDNKGNPIAGAVVSLLKDGVAQAVKQVKTAADGTFTARIAPGRYAIRAVAAGFNAIVFGSVEVRSSQELVYRFNLEPAGSPRTVPVMRNDRDSRKWILRSQQTSRSIFQVREGEDSAIAALEEGNDKQPADPANDSTSATRRGVRTVGVVESYVASMPGLGRSYLGTNFAVARPATDRVDLVFSGQFGVGPGAPQRFETTAKFSIDDRHKVSLSTGAVRMGSPLEIEGLRPRSIGQVSIRAIDEWIDRDGVVVVIGLDYSKFIGAGGASALTPRLGLQFDADAKTRVKAAYAPGSDGTGFQSSESFEDSQVFFRQPDTRPVAVVDGRAVMERSRRFEIGIERALTNESSVEATAFFDTTSGRGVGLLSQPIASFNGETGNSLINIANQQGTSRGLRVVYSRHISRIFSASAGYSFGRGQSLAAGIPSDPSEVFNSGFFQTAAVQVSANLPRGTHVQTVFRFSPRATVFAIDPFAGRLAVYDPSLSILVTQELPTFGLPIRAEAVIDARNLFDFYPGIDDGETFTNLFAARRSVRGGIAVRF